MQPLDPNVSQTRLELAPWQRFSAKDPCPICFGYPEDAARPCEGYLSADLDRAHCTREGRSVDLTCDTRPDAEAVEEAELFVEALEEAEPAVDPADSALSSADLLALEPLSDPWLVEGRLPHVGCSLLVGGPGVGKSSLARDLALAVARGSDWLLFGTRRGRVLYVSLESKLAELRDPFVAQGLVPDDDVLFMDERPEPGLLARILGRAREVEPALVIVDALEPMLRAEQAAQEGASTTPLDRVLDLPHWIGCHVLFVHGLRRGTRELGDLLATTTREVDTVLVLGRSGSQRELRTIQRRGDDLDYPVRVPPLHGRPEAGRAGETLGETVDGEPGPPEHELPSRVLRALRAADRLLSCEEVAAAAGLGPELVGGILAGLKRSGRVLQLGQGTPADPHRYTGCDREAGAGSWLRRVRPWVPITRSR